MNFPGTGWTSAHGYIEIQSHCVESFGSRKPPPRHVCPATRSRDELARQETRSRRLEGGRGAPGAGPGGGGGRRWQGRAHPTARSTVETSITDTKQRSSSFPSHQSGVQCNARDTIGHTWVLGGTVRLAKILLKSSNFGPGEFPAIRNFLSAPLEACMVDVTYAGGEATYLLLSAGFLYSNFYS